MSPTSFRPSLFALLGVALLGHAAAPGADNDWWLARSKENGNEVLYRLRATVPDEATIARYPYLAIVDLAYSPRDDGMRNRDMSEQMYALEDFIEQKLEKIGSATLAFTLTGNGKKQLNYYVADRTVFETIVVTETEARHNLSVHLRFVSDPSWDAFREVRRAAGG